MAQAESRQMNKFMHRRHRQDCNAYSKNTQTNMIDFSDFLPSRSPPHKANTQANHFNEIFEMYLRLVIFIGKKAS